VESTDRRVVRRAAAKQIEVDEMAIYLRRRAELLAVIVLIAGLYEACEFYLTLALLKSSRIEFLLILRFGLVVPLLTSIAVYLRYFPPTHRGANRATVILLLLLPSFSLFTTAAFVDDVVTPCPDHFAFPMCYYAPPPPPPPSPSPLAPPAPFSPPPLPPAAPISPVPWNWAFLCELPQFDNSHLDDGMRLCKGQPYGYLSFIGSIHAVYHHTLEMGTLLRRPTFLFSVLALSSTYLAVILTRLYVTTDRSDSIAGLRAGLAQWGLVVLWLAVAHVIGFVHYTTRREHIWQYSSLRARQERVARSIAEETAHCERLLKNVLPSKILKSLSALSEWTDGPRSKLVAENFTACSFLFAKVNGLSQVINDPTIEPARLVLLLQRIYDRFDKLADVFCVQKVRKTANEYYLVAAGLSDEGSEVHKTAEERASALAGYGFALVNIAQLITVELRRTEHDVLSAVELSVQVGIHSGDAIAGIIGHKTFQYDLCGDSVNTAARMCSHSAPGRIHISDVTHGLLATRFGTEARGEREIKGKGRMHTFFLQNQPPEPVCSPREAGRQQQGESSADAEPATFVRNPSGDDVGMRV